MFNSKSNKYKFIDFHFFSGCLKIVSFLWCKQNVRNKNALAVGYFGFGGFSLCVKNLSNIYEK